MLNNYLTAKTAAEWHNVNPLPLRDERIAAFKAVQTSSQYQNLTEAQKENFKHKAFYFDTEVAKIVWEGQAYCLPVMCLLLTADITPGKEDFEAWAHSHLREDCHFFAGLANTSANFDKLETACAQMNYSTAKLMRKLLLKLDICSAETYLLGFHEESLDVTPLAYIHQKALEVIEREVGVDAAHEKYQELVDAAYEYHDYDDNVLYGTYQDCKVFFNRDASMLELFELNKSVNSFGNGEEKSPAKYSRLATNPTLYGAFYRKTAYELAIQAWNHSDSPVGITAGLEKFALDLHKDLVADLVANIQAYCPIAAGNFSRKEKAHVRIQLLKSTALFKKLKTDAQRTVDLQDFQLLYVFDRLCKRLSQSAIALEDSEIPVWVDQAKTLKGWYDVAKQSSAFMKWFIAECRVSKDVSLSHTDLAKYLKEKSYEELLHLAACDPYAPRGGFSYQTFKKLKEAVPSFKAMEFKLKSELAVLKSALNLCTLFGQDDIALISKVKSFKQDRSLELNLHDLGLFEIRDCSVEALTLWRPFLTGNMELLKYANAKSLGKAKDPVKGDSVKSLKEKLMTTSYENVPDHLSSHVEHAFENGWSQEIMNEFVCLAKKPKERCLIPAVEYVAQGRYKASLIPIGDPRALYIGELSGCCQHINEGAGNDAAVQSYKEEWCSVLLIENTQSGKLLAQAFVWLDKSEKAIVLDSVESVLDEDDEVVDAVIRPMLKGYAQKLRQAHDFSVYLAVTNYGLTAKLRKLLNSDSALDSKRVYLDTYKGKELGYSDADDGCYMIRTVTAKGISDLVEKLKATP